MNGSSLLALCLLVCTGPVLGCDWDLSSYPEHGPTFLVLQSGSERSCLDECCSRPNCDLVLFGFPDRQSPCLLLNCSIVPLSSNDQDLCNIKPSALFKVYRKKGPRLASRSEAEGGEKLSGAPGTGTNETNNIRCRQPMKVGSCRAAFPKFYYDVTNQSCRRFIYGGCGANGNNFNSQEECEDTCRGVTGSILRDELTAAPQMDLTVITGRSQDDLSKSEPSSAKPTLHQNTDLTPDEFAERCVAERQVGPCRAAFQRWYFNSKTGGCESFVYGGCKGNKNNYDSKEVCMTTCAASMDTHGPARDRWTPAIFLFVTLTAISALLLAALVIITLRRHRLPRRPSSVSDKEELLPDPDEQSSLESLTIPESPKLG